MMKSQKVKKSKSQKLKVEKSKVEGRPGGTQQVTLKLPLAPLVPEQYVQRHLDVQLTPQQGEALKRLTNAVAGSGIRLENGRFIATPADAVRYVLEKLAAASLSL